ncbi:hypothetical protein FM020_12750 [Acinetobacter tandoii]|nr:hypothetical protein FM020_12750 [Acinetobacter tandoii]
MQRGIIIPPALIKCDVEKNSVFIERSYNIQELQYFSLYWDRIAIPEQRAIKLGIPFEQDYIEAGILEFVSSPFNSGEMAHILQKSHTYTANTKLQDSENDWTLVNMLGSKDNDPIQYKNKDVLKVELKKLLPIPRLNIAIHDLLDFKTRRKDELIALHESLDEIYEKILNSEDQDLRRKKEFYNLKIAIHNLDKTLLERFRLTSRVDHSVSLEFNESVLSEMIKTGIIDIASATFPALTIANTLRSMLKFKFSKEWTLKSAEGNLKLDYLVKAKNYNII